MIAATRTMKTASFLQLAISSLISDWRMFWNRIILPSLDNITPRSPAILERSGKIVRVQRLVRCNALGVQVIKYMFCYKLNNRHTYSVSHRKVTFISITRELETISY